jgi:hypothetical protein
LTPIWSRAFLNTGMINLGDGMAGFVYQRVADADDIEDAIVVRIWQLDGRLVGEADAPTLEQASTQQVIVTPLGNPVPVRQALANAQGMLQWMPFNTICVQIEDEQLWQAEWGKLLPIKPSPLTSKPFIG